MNYNSPKKTSSDLSQMISDPDHFKKQTPTSSLEEDEACNDILLKKNKKKQNVITSSPTPNKSINNNNSPTNSQKSTTITTSVNTNSPSPSPLTSQFLAHANVVTSSFDVYNNNNNIQSQQNDESMEDINSSTPTKQKKRIVHFDDNNNNIIHRISQNNSDEENDEDDDEQFNNWKTPSFVVSIDTQELLFSFGGDDDSSQSLSASVNNTFTLSLDQFQQQFEQDDLEEYQSLSLPIWDAVTSQDPRLLFYLRGGKKIKRKRGVSVPNSKKHQPEVTIDDLMKQGYLVIGDKLAYTIGGESHTALLLKDGYIEYGNPLERLPSVHNWIITVLTKLTPGKRYHWFSPWDSIFVRGKSLNYIRKSFENDNIRINTSKQLQLQSTKKRPLEMIKEDNSKNNNNNEIQATKVQKSTISSSPKKSAVYVSPTKSLSAGEDHEQTQPMDVEATVRLQDAVIDSEPTQELSHIDIDPNVSFDSSATLTSNSDLPLKYSPHKNTTPSKSLSDNNIPTSVIHNTPTSQTYQKSPVASPLQTISQEPFSQDSSLSSLSSLPSQPPMIMTPDKQSQHESISSQKELSQVKDPSQKESSQREPSQPSQREPSQPSREPSQPSQREPSQPSQRDPSQKDPSQPSQREPSQPSQREPSQKEPSQPSQREPSQKEPTQPSQRDPSQPSQREPSQPSQREPSQPSQKEPSQPSQREPSQKEPSQPSQKEPSQRDPTPSSLSQNIKVPNNSPSSQNSQRPQTIVIGNKSPLKSKSQPSQSSQPSQPSQQLSPQSSQQQQPELSQDVNYSESSQLLNKASIGSSIQFSQPIQVTNNGSFVSPTHHQPSYKSNPPSQQHQPSSLVKQEPSQTPSSQSSSSSSSRSSPSPSIEPYQLPASQTRKPVILGTGLSSLMQIHIATLVTSLGGQMVSQFNNDVTHIVCSCDDANITKRTIKYELGVAKGIWIVNFDWITNSLLESKWVNEEPYEIAGDTEATGSPYKSRQQLMFNQKRLFYGYSFYLSGNFDTPSRQELQQILWESGGVVLDSIPPPPANARELLHSKCVVICHPQHVQTQQQAIKIYLETKHHPISFRWIFDCLSAYEVIPRDKYIVNLSKIQLDQLPTQQSIAF